MESYTFYKTVKFGAYSETIQTQIAPFKEHKHNPSYIKPSQTLKNGFEVYQVFHEFKVNKEGYFYAEEGDPMQFLFYFEKTKFDAYFDNKREIVVFKCPYRIGNALLSEIKAFPNKKGAYDNPSVKVTMLDLDLREVAKKIGDINGAWFANLGDTYAKSSSVYGYKVDNSNMYKEMDSSGELSALYVSIFDSEGNPISVIISKNHSVTIQNKIPDTKSEMDILEIILNLVFQV